MTSLTPSPDPTAAADPTPGPAGPARRRIVQLGAAAVTGALTIGTLAACGGDDDADATKKTEPGSPSPASPNAGIAVATTTTVPVGTTVVVDGVEGDPLVLYRESATTVKAFSAKCPHKLCPVKVAGPELVCPCHGSAFDSRTGAKIRGVTPRGLAARAVTIKGDEIVLA